MEKIKVAFLDRDGTIVKEYDDEGWIGRIKPEFLNNSFQGLKELANLGYKLIIITNQGLINKGLIKWDEYNLFTKNMLDELKENDIEILDIFCCPHRRRENCDCMKPKPGLILQACEKYNINMEESFFSGDSLCDEGIADYFGLDFYGINFNPGKGERVNDLLDVAKKRNKIISSAYVKYKKN